MIEILLLILGLALILIGANVLTDGSSSLAKRFGISEFVVGLTIVAIGTSAPELVVTIVSATKGIGDVAVGNIVGSNIFNSLVILGLTALILPIEFTKSNIKKDIPYGVVASLILLIVASDSFFSEGVNIISRSEGVILIIMFFMFMAYTIYASKNDQSDEIDIIKHKNIFLVLAMIIAGLAMLVFGGNMFLDNAIIVAERAGISKKVIAITLMAGGTSLPELAACVVAAIKKKGEMALGNVIGSNISNIFLILGVGASITPLTLGDISSLDLTIVLVSAILVFVSAFTFRGFRINRIEGALFISIYVAYIASLLM